MQVKIIETHKTEKMVEVELPLYRKHDISGDRYDAIFYYKVEEKDGKLRSLEIFIHEDDGIQINVEENFTLSGNDFILGEGGIFKSTAEEFENALAQAKAMLAAFGE